MEIEHYSTQPTICRRAMAGTRYENLPMKYTVIFKVLKNENFQKKIFDFLGCKNKYALMCKLLGDNTRKRESLIDGSQLKNETYCNRIPDHNKLLLQISSPYWFHGIQFTVCKPLHSPLILEVRNSLLPGAEMVLQDDKV